MFAWISVLFFAIAFFENLGNVSTSTRVLDQTSMIILGLLFLAVHLAPKR